MSAAPRAIRWLFAVLGAWLVAKLGRDLLVPGARVGPLFERFAHDVVLAVAAGLRLARAVPHRSERRPWALIGAGILAWAFGETYYTVVPWTADAFPIPSPADAGHLLMYVLVTAGVLDLLRARTALVPGTLRADGIAAGLASGSLSAALVFGQVQAAAAGEPRPRAPASSSCRSCSPSSPSACSSSRASRSCTPCPSGSRPRRSSP